MNKATAANSAARLSPQAKRVLSHHSDAQFVPRVEKLTPAFDLEHCRARLQHLPHMLLLESSLRHEQLGRYSFLMADPVRWLNPDSIEQLRDILAAYTCPSLPGLPPFQGGLAGMVSYDHNRKLESVQATRFNEFEIDDLAFGLYDVVLAFDHASGEAWLISQGFGASNESERKSTAEKRLKSFQLLLDQPPQASDESTRFSSQTPSDSATQYSIKGMPQLTSNFSAERYLATVQKCIDYIRAGDVFQINLAQRLLAQANCSSSELYSRLRRHNPATFSCYFDLGDAQIISSSPERLISIRDGHVETRPIKGTRPRTGQPQIDTAVSQQLLSSEKDRAENVMIVDLMRNDLSRICTDDSIEVTQLCGLEKYQSVFHLVSVICGQLREDQDAFDALLATFPGGSITGAPKVRAMEIISELEPTARGAYCGSIGYISVDGNADFNILIRTITAKDGYWQFSVGGGLVAQSIPELEYQETWTKAQGMLQAIAAERPT